MVNDSFSTTKTLPDASTAIPVVSTNWPLPSPSEPKLSLSSPLELYSRTWEPPATQISPPASRSIALTPLETPNWLTNSPEELNFCTRLWVVSATQALPLASMATSRGAERRPAPEDSPPNFCRYSHPIAEEEPRLTRRATPKAMNHTLLNLRARIDAPT